MNKTSKKLSLSRTSIRVLRDLSGVAGGLPTREPAMAYTCTSNGTRACDDITLGKQCVSKAYEEEAC